MEFEKILSDKCKSVIDSWRENDIYAISFLIYSNMGETFENVENLTIAVEFTPSEYAGQTSQIIPIENWQ